MVAVSRTFASGVQAERLMRVPVPPPPPPQLVLPPPPPPPPPPPEILHPQFLSPRGQSYPATTTSERTRRSGRSADQLSADDPHARSKAHSRIEGCRIVYCKALFSTTLHRVHSQTVYSCYTVQNYKMQALLPCLYTSWTEVSFSLCETSTGTLPLQMCTSSTAVKRWRAAF